MFLSFLIAKSSTHNLSAAYRSALYLNMNTMYFNTSQYQLLRSEEKTLHTSQFDTGRQNACPLCLVPEDYLVSCRALLYQTYGAVSLDLFSPALHFFQLGEQKRSLERCSSYKAALLQSIVDSWVALIESK